MGRKGSFPSPEEATDQPQGGQAPAPTSTVLPPTGAPISGKGSKPWSPQVPGATTGCSPRRTRPTCLLRVDGARFLCNKYTSPPCLIALKPTLVWVGSSPCLREQGFTPPTIWPMLAGLGSASAVSFTCGFLTRRSRKEWRSSVGLRAKRREQAADSWHRFCQLSTVLVGSKRSSSQPRSRPDQKTACELSRGRPPVRNLRNCTVFSPPPHLHFLPLLVRRRIWAQGRSAANSNTASNLLASLTPSLTPSYPGVDLVGS